MRKGREEMAVTTARDAATTDLVPREGAAPAGAAAASGPDVHPDFARAADPFRRELFRHCYRMLGSVHDAEDLVQETYLRAWRAYDRFEGRSSLRTWLYRIATTQCLTALESRGRRPLPTGLGAPAADADRPLAQRPEVTWLEPAPDALVGHGSPAEDPAAVVAERESLRLALVAAVQLLPPRQRAVLILRDVLKWRAAEVAELVGTSVAAVNSALQRAHAQLESTTLSQDELRSPDDAEQRALIERYVAAFEAKDVPRIVELFTADVVWEMPPFVEWYRGPASIGRHLEVRCPGRDGDWRLRRTGDANGGRPALGFYLRGEDGAFHAFNLQVLDIGAGGIRHAVSFFDLRLFEVFGLPRTLPAGTPRTAGKPRTAGTPRTAG